MMPLRKIQLSILSILGVLALFHSVGFGMQAAPQDDLRHQVNKIIRNENYSELDKLGPPAVPYVLELLESNNKFDQQQLGLFFFLMHTEGREADAALVRLLHHRSAYSRGLAAMYVGVRKIRAAVPELIPLLQDRSFWGQELCRGEYGEADIKTPSVAKVKVIPTRPDSKLLVMDEAVKALESITGLEISESKSFDERATAWLHWWQKQQESKSEWTQ